MTTACAETVEKFEVYVLLKEIGEEKYIQSTSASHYICLLKSKTNHKKTFYTELQTENEAKEGKIRIEFKENYKFYEPPIYYVPIGETSKKLSEMRDYALHANDMIGKDYSLSTLNCQTWVSMFINFIGIDSEIDNSHVLNWNLIDTIIKKINDAFFFKFDTINNVFLKIPLALIMAFGLEISDISECNSPEYMKITKIVNRKVAVV